MTTGPQAPLEPNLQALTLQIYELLDGLDQRPTASQIEHICNILYSTSLLKEEGRPVRARLLIAPPEAFPALTGSPEATHVIRFTTPHSLTANEIKRLSPAASFFHSAVAIWPHKDRGFQIWGILNTGPRWMNLVAGGRKPMENDLPFPMIHVRDPGWMLFYRGYSLLAEWRGLEFHGPRLDVFQSRLLNERFLDVRRQLVAELADDCLPCSLEIDEYAELCHLISLQFVKRIINLVRTNGHGGSLVLIPTGDPGVEATNQWIDCKYSTQMEEEGHRFRHLLQSIIRRVGQLSKEGSSLENAWQVFRNSRDSELDRLEEEFFELARLYSDLMQVDGALVVDHRLCIVGFGGEIRVDRNVLQVDQAHDLDGKKVTRWNVQNDGTRHRSVYRLCSVEPEVIGFVISQDSHVRMIANVNDSVTFWTHTMI